MIDGMPQGVTKNPNNNRNPLPRSPKMIPQKNMEKLAMFSNGGNNFERMMKEMRHFQDDFEDEVVTVKDFIKRVEEYKKAAITTGLDKKTLNEFKKVQKQTLKSMYEDSMADLSRQRKAVLKDMIALQSEQGKAALKSIESQIAVFQRYKKEFGDEEASPFESFIDYSKNMTLKSKLKDYSVFSKLIINAQKEQQQSLFEEAFDDLKATRKKLLIDTEKMSTQEGLAELKQIEKNIFLLESYRSKYGLDKLEDDLDIFERMKKGYKERKKDKRNARWDKLLSPLTSLTGIEGHEIISGLGKKLGESKLGRKIRNVTKPNVQRVARTDSAAEGTILIHNDLLKLLGDEKKKDENSGFLGNLLGGTIGEVLKPLLPQLPAMLGKFFSSTGVSIAGLAGGVLWAAIDGIAGFMHADEWGTSKVSATLGGIFGGSGSGWSGALSNAGKWALLGFGAGNLIMPGLGGIIGALAGAAIGGILGYIGGENIAKAFDKIGAWFNDVLIKPIADVIDFFKTGDMGKLKEAGSIFMKDIKGIADYIANLFGPLGKIYENIIGGELKGIFDFVKDPVGTIKGFFTAIGNEINKFTANPGKWVSDTFNNLLKGISDFFRPITDFFGYASSVISKEGVAKGLGTLGVEVFNGKLNTNSENWGRINSFNNFLSKRDSDTTKLIDSNKVMSSAVSDFYKATMGNKTEEAIKAINSFNAANKTNTIPQFHSGGKAYSEQMALLREGETVLNPSESSEYTKYLVDKEFSKLTMQDNPIDETNTLLQGVINSISSLKDEVANLKSNNVQSTTIINRYSPTSIMNAMGATN